MVRMTFVSLSSESCSVCCLWWRIVKSYAFDVERDRRRNATVMRVGVRQERVLRPTNESRRRKSCYSSHSMKHPALKIILVHFCSSVSERFLGDWRRMYGQWVLCVPKRGSAVYFSCFCRHRFPPRKISLRTAPASIKSEVAGRQCPIHKQHCSRHQIPRAHF